VIVLGGEEAEPGDRLRAFEHGCDDYLAPPFDYEELLARIRAVLRRSTPPERDLVEAARSRSTGARAGSPWPAPPSSSRAGVPAPPEARERSTRVFTKEELLRDVWGFQSQGRTRTLDSHASRLRRKLIETGRGPFVVNVWGSVQAPGGIALRLNAGER